MKVLNQVYRVETSVRIYKVMTIGQFYWCKDGLSISMCCPVENLGSWWS